MHIELEQQLATLISSTKAAASKGLSIQMFKYYLNKPGAPKPLRVGESKDKYFWPEEVEKWNPKQPKQEG